MCVSNVFRMGRKDGKQSTVLLDIFMLTLVHLQPFPFYYYIYRVIYANIWHVKYGFEPLAQSIALQHPS